MRRSEDAEQADDDREQRDAFDERGGEDHLGLDGRGHLGLAGGRLDGATTDATDAEAGTDDGEARTDRGGFPAAAAVSPSAPKAGAATKAARTANGTNLLSLLMI
jgi:hypothetical protein